MPTRVRRGLRVAGKSAWYGFAVLALLLALAVGAATQGLRWLEAHPARVAAWLSHKAGQPIAFSGLRGQWTRRGPLLQLSDLRVGAESEAIPVGQAEVLVAPYAGWLPGRRLTELRLHGLSLTLERDDAGEWRVHGLPGQQAGDGDALDRLEALGELQVIGGRLRVLARGVDVSVPRIDLRLQVSGSRLRAGVRAWPEENGAPLQGSLDMDRERGDGRVYLGARRLDLAGWSQLLRWQGVQLVAGQGRAEAWMELAARRVQAVTTRADLRDVALQPVDPAPGALAEVGIERLRQRMRFAREGEGWMLAAPELAWRMEGRELRMDGLQMRADGQQWAGRAPHLAVGPLLAVLDLSDRLPTGLRHWLGRAQPQGELHDLEVRGTQGRLDLLHAQASGFGFKPVGDAPGLSGVAGNLRGDGDGLSLELDPEAGMVFDWPSGFGPAHPLRARGRVTLWREGAGVRLGTEALDIDGDGYRGHARGGLWFQNDGSRPWIDIAASIDEAAVPVAKKFWIRHLMPREAVEWLDMALLGGRVRNARAIVSGDLDDWPFTAANGRFEARADIEGGHLRFQPDWPPVEAARLHAAFIGPGMAISGSGSLAGVNVDEVSARIANFERDGLEIAARGQGDAARMLALLRASPLEKSLGPTLARVAASGPAQASFNLFQPFHEGAPPQRIDGEVRLDGVTLSERELGLVFHDVRGRARYDGNGFSAEGLAVRHESQPGQLGLRAGVGHVRERGHAFEADLSARLGVEALLAQAPDLEWLKPWLRGHSQWNVDVALPLEADAARARPSQLRLSSNLVGTAIDLPAPLGKPAAEPLATQVSLPMPLDSGEVDVRLGQRIALRARSRQGRNGIRARLGGGAVAEPAPAHGLVVTGRAEQLDALAWASWVGADNEGPGLGPVHVDVRAGQLLLLGQRHANARLQLSPSAAGRQLQVDAASLSGRLDIPRASAAPIIGRFQRADFALARVQTGPAGPTHGEANDIEPAKVPPLDITVDELRLNGKALGRMALHTRPQAAGMQIEALTVDAPGQSLHVSGLWSGQGEQTHTRLQARVHSSDFGALASRLGIDGQVRKGHGEVRSELTWTGAPADFSPTSLQGTLDLDIRDGQLVELEPGAGRVLGLLSLARLPQRLTLDFRDFFDKGFAFDRIRGHLDFSGGQARSEDFSIEGPAARIEISGQTDLRAQRFDQTIEVKPRTGNLLTVAGALAGGPVGAAVGAVANAVLKKPLSEVGARTYRVTGPWDNPKVEVLARPQASARNGASP
ncbi:YhdP family protein [Luteimonas sp. e5]